MKKKAGLTAEADSLKNDVRSLLGITALENVRLFNRYDVENLDKEIFDYAVGTVFSEPQLDTVSTEIDTTGAIVFATEYLPGQFDQRADSAAQCIQIISKGNKPEVRTAKVYLLYGALTEEDVAKIKKYVINPVEAREASLETKDTLATATISLRPSQPLTALPSSIRRDLRSSFPIWDLPWITTISHSVSSILSLSREILPSPRSR